MISASTVIPVETRDDVTEANHLLAGFWSHQRDRPQKECFRPSTRGIFMYQLDLARLLTLDHCHMLSYVIGLEDLFRVPIQNSKHANRPG